MLAPTGKLVRLTSCGTDEPSGPPRRLTRADLGDDRPALAASHRCDQRVTVRFGLFLRGLSPW